MIGRFINKVGKISLKDICLFLIVVFLFIISKLLFSINNSLAYISMNTSNSASNTYGILLEVSNKNNTTWNKDLFNDIENKLKILYDLSIKK